MTVHPPSAPPDVPLPAQPSGVPWPTSGWPAGDLPDDDGRALDALLDQAFSAGGTGADDRFGLSLAFAAVRQGRLLAERHGPTSGPSEQLISWSMAKSVTHALVGVLVGEGRLALHEPAPVPEWADPADPRSAITVDHLLRMVPGTRFNEDYVDEATSHCIEMLFGDGKADMAAYTASQPLEHRPGSSFNYASGTTVVLCRIMADIVGRGPDFEEWMHDVLLDPVGINARLTFDDAGTWVGSSFLHASARDFAKFGLLYLRDGVWEGERLLPEGWVDYARTRRGDDTEGRAHGAHWWVWADNPAVFYASGYETQRIIVDPAADLVLVRLGKTPIELAPNVDSWLDEIRLVLGGR